MSDNDELEDRHKWRSCGCCHVQTAMVVAVVMMFLLSINGFYATSSTTYYLSAVVGALWFISGVSASVAVKKIKPSLLIVTIIITSIFVLLYAFQAIGVLVGVVSYSLGARDTGFGYLLWILLVTSLAFELLTIWFLLVSVKCHRYLKEKLTFLNSNPIDVYVVIHQNQEASQRPDKCLDTPPSYSSLGPEDQSDKKPLLNDEI